MAWFSPLASLGLRADSLPPSLILGGGTPGWALGCGLTLPVATHCLLFSGNLGVEPSATRTPSDHPLLGTVASGMLHNLTVPQFPSSEKCLLRLLVGHVDIPEGLRRAAGT